MSGITFGQPLQLNSVWTTATAPPSDSSATQNTQDKPSDKPTKPKQAKDKVVKKKKEDQKAKRQVRKTNLPWNT